MELKFQDLPHHVSTLHLESLAEDEESDKEVMKSIIHDQVSSC
jgi:hypothetical protein